MTIVLVGGGSGGHITPLLAVARELKKQRPDCKLVYIGEKGGSFSAVASEHKDIDQAYSVSAGKFRRYHGESWLVKLFSVKTNILNVRDSIRFLKGMHESRKLLKHIKPDMVFIKGGFVGVPVGKACAKLRIPYIIHDSDTVPGLANRIIAKQALLFAVGMPKDFYPYPTDRTYEVGIPVADVYKPVTPELQLEYRSQLGLPEDAKIVLITGGSLGAQRLNSYVELIAEQLLLNEPKAIIIHQVGQGNQGLYSGLAPDLQLRVLVREYFDDLYLYSGAADVVVTRAGATAIAELALQGKATLLVPNPLLTGGHQSVNAQRLADAGVVKMVTEATITEDADALLSGISSLLEDQSTRELLGQQFRSFAHPNAAKDLAQLLLQSMAAAKTKVNNVPKKT